MRNSYKWVAGIVIIGASYTAGWYSKPVEVKREVEVVEVEKIVERVKTETIEVVTEKPDGTKVTRRETKEVAERTKDKDERTNIQNETKQGTDEIWSVGLYKAAGSTQSFTGTIDRKVLGNLSVGLYGRYEEGRGSEVGLGLRYSF